MATKRYLLDSSAWLAHLFGEPGVEEVTALLVQSDVEVAISALSLFEVYGRLAAIAREQEWTNLWSTYGLLFAAVIPADEKVVQRAIGLRQATPERLPTVDALIAATASLHGLVLVHRDPHLSRIPKRELSQVVLPVKG
jgi:predicted nucleic acid-binding protein